jgi:hypothetical protein
LPNRRSVLGAALALVALGLFLAAAGCNQGGSNTGSTVAILKPNAAAASLEQAFGKSDPEPKNTAAMACEALRTADYEKAVVSLEVLRARRDLSVQQGMAVHEAEVTLTARLIAAMDEGDQKAKQAYDLLKRGKRD